MSTAPARWRVDRARAVAVSTHLRTLVVEHGRLPNAPLGRLPYGPLEQWCRDHDPAPLESLEADYRRDAGDARGPITFGWIAHRIGKQHSVVARWARRGWLSVDDGDRAAIRLGVHPVTIWSYFHAVTDDPFAVHELDEVAS